MHGDETYVPVVVDEHRGDRMVDRPGRMNSRRKSPNGNACAREVAVNDRWRVIPAAAAGVKQPAAVMIRSPAPRLEARKSPAKSWVPNPLSIGEGRPAIADA